MKILNFLLLIFLTSSIFAATDEGELSLDALPSVDDGSVNDDLTDEGELSLDTLPTVDGGVINDVDELTIDELPESVIEGHVQTIDNSVPLKKVESDSTQLDFGNSNTKTSSNTNFYIAGFVVILVIAGIGFLSRKTK